MIKQIIWTYKLVNFLIRLRGLRGIKSKNGVSSIDRKCHIFDGIIIGMIKTNYLKLEFS